MTTRGRSSAAWLIGLAVVLVAGAALLGWRLAGVAHGDTPPGAAATRPPDVRLSALRGGEMSLDDFRGQVVVVDFWASWCGPCRLQAKILAPLHEELDGRVQFLAINLGEDQATVERYVSEHGFPYPVLMDPEELLGVALDIYALPTVMVLDRDGNISYLRAGISDRPALREALAAAGVTAALDRAAG